MFDTVSHIYLDDSEMMEQVRSLLKREDLELDQNLDYTCGICDEEGTLIATGSAFGETLRCFAVAPEHRGEGLLNRIVTHLTEYQAERGVYRLFVYTKAKSAKFFEDLGFFEIARVDGTLSFLENRRNGFQRFCRALEKEKREGVSAAIVMNANPFTRGHLHLVERAAGEYDHVHLFVLSEEAGPIPAEVRWKLVQEGVSHLPNVHCHHSGPYLISSATFPSYFLRDKADVIRGHARLDLALFGMIAKALGVSVRYVGEEPHSLVTGLYNEIMLEELPKMGINCIEVPRLEENSEPISASTVRRYIHDGKQEKIRALVPKSTWTYFNSTEAEAVIRAIQAEKQVIHY